MRAARRDSAEGCLATKKYKLPAGTTASTVPPSSEKARQQAQAEGLTLRVAKNKSGYFRVRHWSGRSKPYEGGEKAHNLHRMAGCSLPVPTRRKRPFRPLCLAFPCAGLRLLAAAL